MKLTFYTIGLLQLLLYLETSAVRVHDRLEILSGAAVKNQEQTGSKSQFVDSLLMGVLQMLLGGQGGGAPGGVGAQMQLPNQMPMPQPGRVWKNRVSLKIAGPEPSYEEIAIPDETRATAPANANAAAVTQMLSRTNLSPETLIATSLNAERNQMAALNKQIATLDKEIQDWKNFKANAVQSGHVGTSAQNEIQLTIRYPGLAANESQPLVKEQEAEEAMEETTELEAKAGIVDPSTLSVPLIVVAPKSEQNYHDILLKTVKQATMKGSGAELTEKAQRQIQASAADRISVNRKYVKEALSNAEFFKKDKEITKHRLGVSDVSNEFTLGGGEPTEEEKEEE